MKIIKEKEELESKLRFYKKLYRKEIIDYYESLLNLEISTMNRDLIPEDVLEELRHLDFYKDLSRYNIYTHALSVLDNPKLKKSYTGREKLEVISPTHIKDYKVYSYNPEKDSIILYDFEINKDYRLGRINEIKNTRVDVIEKQIKNVEKDIRDFYMKYNIESFDLKIEKEQLEQARYIAELEIKALNERDSEEKKEYAKLVQNQINGINKTFTEFYNIDPKQKILKVGNTKLSNITHRY